VTARHAALQPTVAARLGLDLARLHPAAVDRALAAAAGDVGLATAGAVAERLLGSADEPELWRRLAIHLTVQKSGFFRDEAVFRAIATQHLMPLVARRSRDGDRRLSLWSAGTATGEEAYTLAMLVDEIVPGAGTGGWTVRLVATDLSEVAVATAAAGVFGAQALHGLAPERRRHLLPRPDGRFDVAPATRARVAFVVHNLLHAPPAALGPPPFDLILCRNTLMYLTPDAQIRTVRRLGALLGDDGVLVLGMAEAAIATAAGLEVVGEGAHAIFRRPGEGRHLSPVLSEPFVPPATGDVGTPSVAPLPPPPWPPSLPPPRSATGRRDRPGRTPEADRRTDGQSDRQGAGPVLDQTAPEETTPAAPATATEAVPGADGDRAATWRVSAAEAEERDDLVTAEIARRHALGAGGGTTEDRFLLGALLIRRGKWRAARDVLSPLLAEADGGDTGPDRRLAAAARRLLVRSGRRFGGRDDG
jgi:chemotaxis protein methyltransferase CheR